MTRARSEELLPLDPEIDRTFHQYLRERYQAERGLRLALPMAEEQQQREPQERIRSLMDYANPTMPGATSSIRRPPVAANNFEIKLAFIQLI